MPSTISHSPAAVLRSSARAEFAQAYADLRAEDMPPAAAQVYAEKLAGAFLRGAAAVTQTAALNADLLAAAAADAMHCRFDAPAETRDGDHMHDLPDAASLSDAVLGRTAPAGWRARVADLFGGRAA